MFEACGDLVVDALFGLEPAGRLGPAVQFFVVDVAKIFALPAVVISGSGC